MIQNIAARFLIGCKTFSHVTPLLSDLSWLPIESRIELKILLFMYKSINHKAPNYFSPILLPYRPFRSLKSENHLLCNILKTQLKGRGDREFSEAGPILWNNLPQYI